MSNIELLNKVADKTKKKIPEIEVGHTVRVHQRIKEGDKERIQIYEGLVMAINSGHGVDKTFTVRKVVEGIGVERIFPILSPLIEKIEIKKKSKIRRAKLYYMRDRSGKSARLKSRFLSDEELGKSEGAEIETPEVEGTVLNETPQVEETQTVEETQPESSEENKTE